MGIVNVLLIEFEINYKEFDYRELTIDYRHKIITLPLQKNQTYGL